MDEPIQSTKNNTSIGLTDQLYQDAYEMQSFKHLDTLQKSSEKYSPNNASKASITKLDVGDIWNGLDPTRSNADSADEVTKSHKDNELSQTDKNRKVENKKESINKNKSKNDRETDLHKEIDNQKKDKTEKQDDEPKEKASAKVQEFTTLSLKLFDRIDKNKDGKIAVKEMATAIEDPGIKGLDAHILATMYKQRQDLQKLSRGSSITRDGLKEFNSKLSEHDLSATATDKMKELVKNKAWMKKVDTNGDGYLMKVELKKALENKNQSWSEQHALKYFIKNHRMIKRLNNDKDNFRGISSKDIERSRQRLEEYQFADVIRGIYWSLDSAKERGKGNLSLYANKDNPVESIKPGAIRQGSIGNCYFMAALASVSATNPEAIKNMIKDNRDGTYTVTFPGAKNEPITIKAPTKAEQILYNGGSKYGAWASVIEKAYGKYCQKSYWRRANTNFTGGNTPAEGSDNGGRWGGLKLLTGGVDRVDGGLLESMPELSILKARLTEAFSKESSRALIASRSPLSSSAKDGSLARRHMYSIIGYNPEGDDGGSITIRNPWGSKYGKYGNTFKMSLKEFRDKFTSIAYGAKQKRNS